MASLRCVLPRRFERSVLAGLLFGTVVTATATAGEPDLKLGELPAPSAVGRIGTFPDGISAFSLPLTLCNEGDAPASWNTAMAEAHPGVTLQLYRVATDAQGIERFEQLGASWVFHSYAPISQSFCAACPPGGPLSELGPACSTSHGSATLGDRFWLGPRSEWNAHAGTWTCLGSYFDGVPVDCVRDEDGSGLDAIAHRLTARDADLAVPGATFYHEALIVSAGDSDPFDDIASRSHVPTWTGSSWSIGSDPVATNPLVDGPAILRWGDAQTTGDHAPHDGAVILAADVTDLGGGEWRYEYALFNRSLDRKVDGLTLVAGAADAVSFRDLDLDTSNDWTAALSGDVLSWTLLATGPFEAGAGPLEFGTLYNFGFTSDQPPVNGEVELALHLPGPGAEVLVLETLVPDHGVWVDFAGGTEGGGGIPALTGSGPLTPGSANSMQLSGAAPSATATLVVGFELLSAPFSGGTLVPQPDILVAGPLIDGTGSWALPFTWPPGTPSGLGFIVQMWVADPAGPFGLAASNGLAGTSP